MTISSTGTATITPVASTFDFGAGAVSPDALLAYCNAKLSQVDGNINTLMKQESATNKMTTDLNGINQDLQNKPNGFNVAGVGQSGNSSIGTTTDQGQVETTIKDIDAKYDDAIAQANASGDGNEAAELQTQKANFDKTANTADGGDDCMSSQEVSDAENAVQGALTDSSNNAQMVMVNLQQLLSSRQQILSLTSNMLQTVNDSDKSVINNIHSS